jgi:hypothetical protein
MRQGVRGKISQSFVCRERIVAKAGFDPEKCQKERFTLAHFVNLVF